MHLFINNYWGIEDADVNKTAPTLLYANGPTQSIGRFSLCDGIYWQTIEDIRGKNPHFQHIDCRIKSVSKKW